MNQPATEDCDPSDFVDAAVGAGVRTYQLLTGLRQGMINFFVAAIYQCFELRGNPSMDKKIAIQHAHRETSSPEPAYSAGQFGVSISL